MPELGGENGETPLLPDQFIYDLLPDCIEISAYTPNESFYK
jgi:hypothetical protein